MIKVVFIVYTETLICGDEIDKFGPCPSNSVITNTGDTSQRLANVFNMIDFMYHV